MLSNVVCWKITELEVSVAGKRMGKEKTIVIEPVDNIALFQHLPQWKMHPLLNIDGDLHYLASASSTGKKKSFEYI